MFISFISRRYLKSNKGFASVITWFSFIGIALGVATLIIVTSVMNGFKHDLLERIIGMKGHIVITSNAAASVSDYRSLYTKLTGIPSISSAIPTIERQSILIYKGFTRGVIINSISSQDLPKKDLIYNNIISGSSGQFTGHNVLIGIRLAEILNLNIGDSLVLMVPGGVITPFGSLPKQDSFTVSGIFKAGMIDYDKNIIVMPLDSAQEFFGMNKTVSQIDVFVNNIENTDKAMAATTSAIGNNYRVLDWKHSDSSIFHAVKVEKNVMTLILSIIILVAVFNIISGLTMLTSNKTRDIAILRTMGASKSSILKIFLMIGTSIGTLGTVTGVSLGLLVSANIDRIKIFLEKLSNSSLFSDEIYFLSQIPSKTDCIEVLLISIFSLLFCFIATIYPAKKAADLDPAEALRI